MKNLKYSNISSPGGEAVAATGPACAPRAAGGVQVAGGQPQLTSQLGSHWSCSAFTVLSLVESDEIVSWCCYASSLMP